jgi:ribosomal protein L11 methylase PrmA
MNAATQLLERCQRVIDEDIFDNTPEQAKLLEDIEAYLAKQQVEQEPVGYVTSETINDYNKWTDMWKEKREPFVIPLYTSPQAREPLSDDDIESVWRTVEASDFRDCVVPFARAIEAYHGIK